MKINRLALVISLAWFSAFAPSAAFAQYQWLDDNGRMVFSDRPPPASVTPNKVKAVPLKVVSKMPEKAPEADSKSPALAAQVVGAAAPKSLADKDLEAKKRNQDLDEAAKKQKADAERQAKLATACADATTNIKTLESGMRVARVGKNGEREFMSDDDKTKRVADLKKEFADNCAGKIK